MQFLILISGIIVAFYLALIIKYIFYWRTYKADYKSNSSILSGVSVIVVARNEEITLTETIKSILNQTYPKDKFELIIVNDNSTDSTQVIISNYLKASYNIKSILLDESKNEYSKKCGIEKAIRNSSFDLILVTDADCTAGTEWINTIANCFSNTNTMFVSAPVVFKKTRSIFSKLLFVEFASLIGAGAASIIERKPMMCNGANMAFRKEIFYEVNGYEGNRENPSGDDVFLMMKIFKKYKNGIIFLKERNAIIKTQMPNTLKLFIEQRLRWASKVKNYNERHILFNGLIVFLINFLILITAVFSFVNTSAFYAFLAVYFIKSTVDYVFLLDVLKFFENRKLSKYIIFEELFYVFYVTIIFFLSFRGSYFWKGRKIKI
ncbi:MAG: glycosyltransferase [Bacteroidota bacterium]